MFCLAMVREALVRHHFFPHPRIRLLLPTLITTGNPIWQLPEATVHRSVSEMAPANLARLPAECNPVRGWQPATLTVTENLISWWLIFSPGRFKFIWAMELDV